MHVMHLSKHSMKKLTLNAEIMHENDSLARGIVIVK